MVVFFSFSTIYGNKSRAKNNNDDDEKQLTPDLKPTVI